MEDSRGVTLVLYSKTPLFVRCRFGIVIVSTGRQEDKLCNKETYRVTEGSQISVRNDHSLDKTE